MLDQESIQKQQELLAVYRRNLAHLLAQAAQYGGEVFALPQTINGIYEAREHIQRIKLALHSEGVIVEDQPNDAPLIQASTGAPLSEIQLPDTTLPAVPSAQGQPDDLLVGKRQHRHIGQRTLYIMLTLALVLVLGIAVVTRLFQNRVTWQRIGNPIPYELLHIVRINNTLLVSTTTSTGACNKPGDTGLWRGSLTQVGDWEQIYVKALEFQDQSGACVLAEINSFAEGSLSGSNNRVIYAATSNVGLLASRDDGNTWNRIDTDPVRALLSNVVILGSNPEQVVVAASSGGLYRQQATGTWQRLDGAICPANGNGSVALPQGFTVGALLAADGALYAGSQAFKRDEVTSNSGLYVSRDGGVCWQKIDTATIGGIYGYRALVATGQPNELLVITNRLDVVLGEVNHQLWRLQGANGRTQPLWETPHTASALAVAGSYWYVATDAGSVARGKLAGGLPEALPTFAQCTVEQRKQACFADLVGADETDSILLMGDGIYRLEILPWYRIW